MKRLLSQRNIIAKYPTQLEDRLVIAVDPMFTLKFLRGRAIARLKEAGARELRLLSLLAAPEGVARMKEVHPDVRIFSAALDERLNEKGCIIPILLETLETGFLEPVDQSRRVVLSLYRRCLMSESDKS